MIFTLLDEKFFYNELTIQQLTVIHVVIHIGNKSDMYRSLNYWNFKTLKHR